jgi:hypothetical protein
MLKKFAGAALALSLTLGATAAMATPITGFYTDDFGHSQIKKVAGDDFSDDYQWDFGVAGTVDAALVSILARSNVTFTSIVWDGVDLISAQTSAAGGLEFDNLSVHTGINTLKLVGNATGTGTTGAYAGTIDFLPAPAPLAAGLPLLLTGGVLAMRKRRRDNAVAA